jgi:hypothetical protein
MNRVSLQGLGAAKEKDFIAQIKETICGQPAAMLDDVVKYTGYAKWTVFGMLGVTLLAMFGPPIYRIASKKKEQSP